MRSVSFALACAAVTGLALITAPGTEDDSPFGEWVEPDAPFVSCVVDARTETHPENLVPRAIVLRLGHDIYAAVDTDLCRLACVWTGEFLPMTAMGPGSYRVPAKKAPPGQGALPRPLGEIRVATAREPDLRAGGGRFVDPREPASSPEEVGLGALPEGMARFGGIELDGAGVTLHYTIGEVAVEEQIRALPDGGGISRAWRRSAGDGQIHVRGQGDGFAPLPPEGLSFALHWDGESAPALGWDEGDPSPRWPETVTTKVRRGAETQGALIRDELELPVPNPWKRNVRFADIAFFPDGSAALCTFDGDLWLLDDPTADELVWRRFASGFHEPKSLVVREGELFVFDRSGIWRVHDRDGDGEAEVLEMFCNLFSQTAETREFAMDMELAPEGAFVIAKGGQSSSTVNKHGGRVLRIAPDGKSFSEIAWGFRQPYIGVDPETGIVTASDQQGHYTPTTPIHFLRENGYRGFRSNALGPVGHGKPPLAEEIVEPDLWIPHPVNQSGASQVWARDSALGPLEGELLHIGYMKPELFVIHRDPRGLPQAGVSKLWQGLPFSPLSGTIGADGHLYLTGFRIWGTIAEPISGLVRIRHAGETVPHPAPVMAAVAPEGVYLQFAQPVDPAAVVPGAFFAERWNYRRTPAYGSPHYRPDGAPGQELLPVASASRSGDGRGIFVGIPGMAPCDTLALRYDFGEESGATFLTVRELAPLDFAAAGFGELEVDLEVKAGAVAGPEEADPSAEEGARLAVHFGCIGCHSVAGKDRHKLGPEWNGLFGTKRELVGGDKAKVDHKYLREAIIDPTAKVAKGFDKEGIGMPNYLGILSDAQIASLVLYIESLK